LLLLSATACFVGSLTGLGGGVVLVPVYTLVLGVPIEYAASASLASTIATSLGTSGAVLLLSSYTQMKVLTTARRATPRLTSVLSG